MTDLFKEIIPSILQTNQYSLESESDEKEYKAFLVNKSLSGHIDCLGYAAEMNMNHSLDNKLQYDFLFHSIRKYKRQYQKWMKVSDNNDIKMIQEYFSYSAQKAKQVLPLLSTEQLKIIAEKLEKGGKSK